MTKEALHRFATARQYIEAIKMICTSPHIDSEQRVAMTVLPLNMLAGFALEIYFKAWLLAAGRDSKTVKAFGHKVTELYGEALGEDLPDVAQLPELVQALGEGHEDFTYRYIDSGATVNLIRWEYAIAVLDALDDIVEFRVVAAARTRGIPVPPTARERRALDLTHPTKLSPSA